MDLDTMLELLSELEHEPDTALQRLVVLGREGNFLPGLVDVDEVSRPSKQLAFAQRVQRGAPPPLHRRGYDALRALLLAVERGWLVPKGGQLGPLRDPLIDEAAELLDVGGAPEDRAMSLAALLEFHAGVDEVYATDEELAALVRVFDEGR